MRRLHSSASFPSRSARACAWLGGAAASVFALCAPGSAQAHIRLLEPPSWVVESALGDPQKQGPCGGDDVQETGAVSTFRAGQQITVRWQETVGHSGHFRISLARDRADLVDPAVVTSNGDGSSGNSISAAIMDPVAYPVLADNLFPRDDVSTPQAEPFSTTVTLPDEECESCTLQVVQFMAQHPPGYFYHHCANLRIVAADADLPDDQNASAGGSIDLGADAGAAETPGGVGGPRGSSATDSGKGTDAAPIRPSSSGAAGSGSSATSGSATSSVGAADADDGSDAGCSVTRRNPARISRAVMAVLSLMGMVALWRRRRAFRRRR